jgi:hypothetical protein
LDGKRIPSFSAFALLTGKMFFDICLASEKLNYWFALDGGMKFLTNHHGGIKIWSRYDDDKKIIPSATLPRLLSPVKQNEKGDCTCAKITKQSGEKPAPAMFRSGGLQFVWESPSQP